MLFKSMSLHRKRHGLLNYVGQVAWLIKLFLQPWEFMGICCAILRVPVVDPEFKKNHFVNDLLRGSSAN